MVGAPSAGRLTSQTPIGIRIKPEITRVSMVTAELCTIAATERSYYWHSVADVLESPYLRFLQDETDFNLFFLPILPGALR